MSIEKIETQKSSSTFKLQPVFFVRRRAECVHDYITQKHRNKETLMNVNQKVQDFSSIILGKMEYLSDLSKKMESESDLFQRFPVGRAYITTRGNQRYNNFIIIVS